MSFFKARFGNIVYSRFKFKIFEMKKPAISVFIITKNEADRIASVIKAVREIADEILIIDSGSLDKTLEIAQNLGAKVFYNKWQGYGPQKVFGESLCKNKWILNIDADEEVMPELAQEISNLFSKHQQDEFVGYKIRIVNKFFGEEDPKKWAYYYNQLRLYNKEYCGFRDSTVHDSVVVRESSAVSYQSSVGQLKNIIAHQSFRSYLHWIEKINSYSSMQAEDAFRKGKNVSVMKIFITPFFAFFKAYFLRRYFIYGVNGIAYSTVFAFGRVLKLIKIREKFKTGLPSRK